VDPQTPLVLYPQPDLLTMCSSESNSEKQHLAASQASCEFEHGESLSPDRLKLHVIKA